jgi:hypothetical protein
MDTDPRDFDSRDDDLLDRDRESESREPGDRRDLGDGGDHRADDRDRDHDWRQPEDRSRDRDDDARTVGRGPGNSRNSHADEHARDRDDVRWIARDSRDRSIDPRDVFTRGLSLPRGLERETVRDRDRVYRCAVRKRERLRPSARFEWSPVVTFGITTAVQPIRAR